MHNFLTATVSGSQHPIALNSLSGAETISKLFAYEISFVSDDKNISTWLNKNIFFQVNQEEPLLFHGLITGISVDHELQVSLKITSWFESLKNISASRTFHHQSVLDIFSTLCHEQGFYDFDFSFLKQSYEKIIYSVQYHESIFDYLSRILLEAGIDYFFSYEKNRHVMHLIDDVSALKKYSRSDLNFYPHETLKGKEYVGQNDQGLHVGVTIGSCVVTHINHHAFDRDGLATSSAERIISQYSQEYVMRDATEFFTRERVVEKTKIAILDWAKVRENRRDELDYSKVDFDWEDKNQSCWLSISPPQVSEEAGTFLKPEEGDVVLVQYEGGDPCKPFITGSVFKKNELMRDDAQIFIKSPASSIIINDINKTKNIHLKTEGDFEKQVARDEVITVKNAYDEKVGGDFSCVVQGGVILRACSGLSFQVGGSSMVMTPEQIMLDGVVVNLG